MLRDPLGTFPAPLQPASGTNIRIVTYNILADQYASQEFARNVLFKHVPGTWLDIHYRKQLVWKQLVHSAADIVCLQEVDAKVFDLYLSPLLKREGYSGVFDNKAGQVSEGSAIFFRDSLFTSIGRFARSRADLSCVGTPETPPAARLVPYSTARNGEQAALVILWGPCMRFSWCRRMACCVPVSNQILPPFGSSVSG